MLSRGWHEHDWEPEFEHDKFLSQAFEFLYCRAKLDAFRIPHAPFQLINKIMGEGAITTKIGLTHNMKNLIWRENIDTGRVFPRSFDVSDQSTEEFKDFKEDFKFTFVTAYLNTALQSHSNFTKNNFWKVVIALVIAERRCHILSGRFFEDLGSAAPSELDTVSDAIYEYLTKSNVTVDLSRTPWYRPI